MNLPKVIASLIEAQNNHDSEAYTDCFSDNAIVHDEGKIHEGTQEIRQWIEHSDLDYHTELRPLSYKGTETESLLTAEVSGDFPGSPAILQFYFILENDLIRSLHITG